MPISLINQMRREAIELLDEARIPVKGRAYKDSKIKYSPKKYAKDTNSNSKIRVKINNIEALKSIINLDIDMIYYEDVKNERKYFVWYIVSKTIPGFAI